jgi:hypothetical protein
MASGITYKGKKSEAWRKNDQRERLEISNDKG